MKGGRRTVKRERKVDPRRISQMNRNELIQRLDKAKTHRPLSPTAQREIENLKNVLRTGMPTPAQRDRIIKLLGG